MIRHSKKRMQFEVQNLSRHIGGPGRIIMGPFKGQIVKVERVEAGSVFPWLFCRLQSGALLRVDSTEIVLIEQKGSFYGNEGNQIGEESRGELDDVERSKSGNG